MSDYFCDVRRHSVVDGGRVAQLSSPPIASDNEYYVALTLRQSTFTPSAAPADAAFGMVAVDFLRTSFFGPTALFSPVEFYLSFL